MSNKMRKAAFTLNKDIANPYDLYNHLPYRVAVASNLLEIDRDAAIKQLTELETREIRVLLNVGSYGPINAADIAYQSRLDPYSVNRAINCLLKLNYIAEVKRVTNQKVKRVALTQSGLTVYQKITTHLEHRTDRLTANLTIKEQSTLLALLEKLELQAEQVLAETASVIEAQGEPITRDQKELIRWYKRTSS
ncbi:MarR family transcriptional regulator [Pseudoalteromonas aurantia]|uniref:MarR family transcriptional regulator n=2 Tax=Pseudoalteromonas TaxID=53246 RepID=A0ABY2W368_9GAMM|nr:MarR family transcriptional regulator [Pseudoalteromonas aurantia]TMO60421.1 MarR family transcriptional regulator [Pseudoalteromonas aurantia]TMO79102.1 MarR family transcriptional regulator [Pseudoalteromonas aurantia]